jgi:Holliday junction resolvasome RuvABC endonuclease subunit
MPEKPVTILGINPGTRYLGIAIFRGSTLLDWKVIVLKGKWSSGKLAKARNIILTLIHRFEPRVLAVKKLSLCRSSKNLNGLICEIEKVSSRNGLQIERYSIDETKAFYSPEKINKKKMAEIIASEYPDLFFELNREKSCKNPYYIRMFEAVALGAMAAQTHVNS